MHSRQRLGPALATLLMASVACACSPAAVAPVARRSPTTTAAAAAAASTTVAAGAGTTTSGSSTPTPPPTTAPPVPAGATHPGATTPATAPKPVPVVAWNVGDWVATGPTEGGGPAVWTTQLQRSGAAPIGAARLDVSRLRVALYAGTADPGGTWSNQGSVPASLWPSLVATFNSGFTLKTSRGGFYADGRAAPALRNGAASLVIFQDGSATVGQWGRDVSLNANVVAVRQNLELLVDGGHPSSKIATNVQPNWGFTLNNIIVNWRSAVGVDGAGDLLYVGGPGLDPNALASALIAVGAVRAMELDINPAWVSFDSFTPAPGATAGAAPSGTKLLAGMNFSANHFLAPFDRDFFAVFTR